jgi:hypothetical protein
MQRPTHASRTPITGALVATLLLGACVMGGQAAPQGGRSAVVSGDEIERSTAANRGRGSPNLRGSPAVRPVVYIANVRQGGIDYLRTIAIASLVELRYVDAITATTRYGEGHSGGIIEVDVRRR